MIRVVRKYGTGAVTRAVMAQDVIDCWFDNPIDKLVCICLASMSVSDLEISIMPDLSDKMRSIVSTEKALFVQDVLLAAEEVSKVVGMSIEDISEAIFRLHQLDYIDIGIAPDYVAPKGKELRRTYTQGRPCSIYVMGCDEDGLIKIGISKDPARRQESLNAAFPRNVNTIWHFELPTRDKAASLEALTHNHFADKRTTGEWFKMKPEEAITFLRMEIGIE